MSATKPKSASKKPEKSLLTTNGTNHSTEEAKTQKPAATSPFRSPSRIQEIVTLLKLVTAPSRQMIILLLADGEKNVGEICAALESNSQPAVSHQLSLLRHGRLIEAMRNGRNVYYQLTESGHAIAKAFLVLAKTNR